MKNNKHEMLEVELPILPSDAFHYRDTEKEDIQYELYHFPDCCDKSKPKSTAIYGYPFYSKVVYQEYDEIEIVNRLLIGYKLINWME